MAIESDVLVVGGGLAGCVAALSAADDGATVRVVTGGASTLRQASGLLDVLGYHDGTLVSDPFTVLTDLPVGHPYERVGLEAVRAGLDRFDDAVSGYAGGHTDNNALVPTVGGSVKPTARYPCRVAAGLASRPADTLLVGFETLVDFDAPLAADHLERTGVPFDVSGITVGFPADLRADAATTRYARALDRDERVREVLASVVEPHAGAVDRVGFPAVLGTDRHETVRETLESRLDVSVFEIPTGPPSLLGTRLETSLYEALDAATVRLDAGVSVVGYEADESGGRIDHVLVERPNQIVPHHAAEFVLATGGLVGKGIDSDRHGVREPVFDCHVPHPADRYDWFEPDAFGEHPFARFGVDVDRELRPRDAHGRIEHTNLRAVGSVLGGADFAAEKSGGGISLATGHRAGTLAAEEAR